MAGSAQSSSEFRFPLAAISTFRDQAACERVRRIPRSEITAHANPNFHIAVIDDADTFYRCFADDLVGRIRASRDAGTGLVLILPVGPVPQFRLAAAAINAERLSLRHVHTFNMDEYADEHGQTAPVSWEGSFQRAMWASFFGLIDEELRPPAEQIHFPTTDAIGAYSAMIEDLGGADVVYGGIGWGGHIAFWEPQLGHEFAGDMAAYRRAGARTVELHPMTIMQNALHSFGGDWSWVPPQANTIGPREILGAKHRSFWLDGDLGNGYSWQRFIARLVAHGPVSEFVPGSLLQEAGADYTMLGSVADDLVIDMA
jgi:glucosamine-6-phosphate deaminase